MRGWLSTVAYGFAYCGGMGAGWCFLHHMPTRGYLTGAVAALLHGLLISLMKERAA